jgi:hypothetical protein
MDRAEKFIKAIGEGSKLMAKSGPITIIGGRPDTRFGKPHELIIKSLHDGEAECSAGDWSYRYTGEVTKETIEAEFQKHLGKLGESIDKAKKLLQELEQMDLYESF